MEEKTSKKLIRILVVDDHAIIRDGMELLLNRQDDMIVCGVAEDAESAMYEIERLKPDLVMLDISLPGGKSGVELTRVITQKYPGVPVLILSMHDEVMYAKPAILAGARGYVQKQELTNTIIAAIHKIMDGEIFLSRKITTSIIDTLMQTGITPIDYEELMQQLTDREKEVFRYTAHNLSSKEIGDILDISDKTVDTHKFRIREKLGISDSKSLVKKAREFFPDF